MASRAPGKVGFPDRRQRPARSCNCARMKRWTTQATIATFFLAGGIEYSVIFPTMWDYVQAKGGEEWLYGLTLAAFSISNLLAGPVYGFVFDMTHQTKMIVLVANLFEIGGNFMYFSATSKYMILGSRFIVGLGAGAGATLYGELARISTKKERTKVFSLFSTFRQVGLILGPAFNLFLRVLKVSMGPFVLNKLTAPGALMTIVWLVIEAMFLFLFYQLPSAVEPVQDDRTRHNGTSTGYEEQSMKSDIARVYSNVHEDGDEKRACNGSTSIHIDSTTGEEHTPLLSAQPNTNYSLNSDSKKLPQPPSMGAINRNDTAGSSEDTADRGMLARACHYVTFVASQMVREEVVVLLAVLFLTIFSQTAIETMLVPMAENLLGWTERDTSIFYSCAGVEILIAIVVVYIITRWVGDRWQLMIGLGLNVFGYAWMFGWIGNSNKHTPGLLWKFMGGAGPIIFGLPFFLVTGASLYSKMLPMQVQGIGQGLRRSIFSVAAILGPLWAGGALGLHTYYILLAVPLALLIFVTILVIFSFVRLKEPKGKHTLLP